MTALVHTIRPRQPSGIRMNHVVRSVRIDVTCAVPADETTRTTATVRHPTTPTRPIPIHVTAAVIALVYVTRALDRANRSKRKGNLSPVASIPAVAPTLARELHLLTCSNSCDHENPVNPMDQISKTMLAFQTYHLLYRVTQYNSRDAKITYSWQQIMNTQM